MSPGHSVILGRLLLGELLVGEKLLTEMCRGEMYLGPLLLSIGIKVKINPLLIVFKLGWG